MRHNQKPIKKHGFTSRLRQRASALKKIMDDNPCLIDTFYCIAYSNKAKIKVLGVSEATLKKYGAVHEKTVKEMADGARHFEDPTYGI